MISPHILLCILHPCDLTARLSSQLLSLQTSELSLIPCCLSNPHPVHQKKKPFILTFNIDPESSCFLLSPLLDTNSSDHLLLPEFFRSLLWGFPAFPHAPLWDSTWSSHLDPLKAKVRSYNSSETIWRLTQPSQYKSQSEDGGQKAYVICLPFLVSFITTSMSAFLTTLHLPLLFLRNPYKFPLLDSF